MECIFEMQRIMVLHANRRAPKPSPGGIWHLAGEGDSNWRAIKCSASEGIVLPGNSQDREPTCPDCRQIAGLA